MLSELKQIIEEQDEFEKSKYEAAKSAIDYLNYNKVPLLDKTIKLRN